LFREDLKQPKRAFYGSTDFPKVKNGLDRKYGDLMDLRGKAGEFIYSLPNGFHAYYLAGENGERQNVAPADVVANTDGIAISSLSAHNNPTIQAPSDCMRCHARGLQGGKQAFDFETYIAPKVEAGLVSKEEVEELKKYWMKNTEYLKKKQADNEIFQEALSKADAAIGAFPLMPDLVAAYHQDVSFDQLARELGLPKETLTLALFSKQNASWRKRLGLKDDLSAVKTFAVPREKVEALYCDLKKTLLEQNIIKPPPASRQRQPASSQPNHSSAQNPGTTGRPRTTPSLPR
jgi:hypothetical protein